MQRTHTCGELNAKNAEQNVTLCGWVHRRRDHGGLIFVDLRDAYGLTQIVFDPERDPAAHAKAEKIRSEWVISVTGMVEKRKEGMENDDMSTGEIEISVQDMTVLSTAQTPPFELDTKKDVREDLRLQYRYLDLRREKMQKNLRLRHRMTQVIRQFFDSREFVEVETPIMVKGTPEGSREYLVPSRVHPGTFYVLPQSPQQLKQLLMVGGVDKYFQIARCFRDEDLRGDRQPEFTQFEIEMSFVDQEDIMNTFEECFVKLTDECAPHKEYKKHLVCGAFRRMTWQEALEKYGSDKPDLRFDMKIKDVTNIVKDSGFGVFAKAVQDGGTVRCLRVEGGAELSRKEIDALTDLAKGKGAKGLAYIMMDANGELRSPIIKFMKEEEVQAIIDVVGGKPGDALFFGADEFIVACESLGAVRSELGDRFEMKNDNEFAFAWVYNFPMFEKKEDGSIQSAHHPFTRPLDEDLELLKDPKTKMQVRSYAYDLVMNGVELGGGSIRIHDAEKQWEVFDLLGFTREDAEMKFGHMMKAFSYGCPPHGGAAMGLDRVVMLFADEPNIREVMAFPKNQSAQDTMLGAPAPMPEKELREQNIQILERD